MKRVKNLRAAAGETFALESLENRQHLAADLAVAWDVAGLHLPAILVPGDRLNFGTGPNRFDAPVQVKDLGPQGVAGTLRLDYFLSTDATLDPAHDVLLGSVAGQPFSLGVFMGNANQIATFKPTIAIPAGVAPGTYHLIVRMTSNGSVNDNNVSNNVAVTDATVEVARRFGDFSGRTGVALTLQDPDGTLVTFRQTGGGSGEVAPIGAGFGVTLTGSNDFTQVQITASGGDGRYDLSSVSINGSVGTFNAPQGRLTGALTTTTGFGAMTFGDVVGPRTITVPASSRSPSFTFGNVSELTIDSAVGINSINVSSWIDRDGVADHIRAPWLGALTSAGNFYPSIFLTSGVFPIPFSLQGHILGPVNIGGVVKAGVWSVNGSGGAISVYATTAGWSATFQGGLDSITTIGSFRGVLTAGYNINQIVSGRDILAGKILAGTYLGDDGVFGGTGSNADIYRAGVVADIRVAHNVAGTFIAAGLDPVDGVFNNGNDKFSGGYNSYIGRIIVGHIVGAQVRFLSNAYSSYGYETSPQITIGGASIDWQHDQRFAIHSAGPSATIMSTSMADAGGSTTATLTLNIAAAGIINLDSIVDGSIRITGPNGFSSLALLQEKAHDGNSNDGSAAYTVFSVRLNNVGDVLSPGTYTISFVPNMIADMRGNFAPAQDIGTFMVV